MCSGTLCAPGGNAGAWVIVLAAAISAAGAAPAAAAEAVVPVGATVDRFDLARTSESPRVEIDLAPVATDGAADAQPAPVPVPLPPSLATGLVGLGSMALLRVGRRAYRR